jgi:hypothetical protein
MSWGKKILAAATDCESEGVTKFYHAPRNLRNRTVLSIIELPVWAVKSNELKEM